MNTINGLNKKLLFAPILLALALNAGTYDDNYSVVKDGGVAGVQKNVDTFMNGEFEEIVRFDMIRIDCGGINPDSQNILDNSIKKIKEYVDDHKDIKVTIIGHTKPTTDDANELSVASKIHARNIEGWFT